MTIRYEPVGQCIYCGTKKGPLSREHIVALGLGGEWLLPEASCDACGAITGAIEQYCLRKMFGSFRHSTGMPTRRPNDRPSSLPVKLWFEDGTEGRTDIAPDAFPASLNLARLPPARALRGLPDDNSIVEGVEWWSWFKADKISELAENTGASSIGMGTCNPTRFSQMLAKIAHGYAVATFGLAGFQPLAIDLALGRTEHMNYLVGAQIGPDSNEPSKNLHEMKIWTVDELLQMPAEQRDAILEAAALLAEDKVIGARKLGINPERVRITAVEAPFRSSQFRLE